MTSPDHLDVGIIDAWQRDDGEALAGLYATAGQSMLDASRIDEGCFFLTQAYVLALEHGLGMATRIHAELVRQGREE